MRFWILPAICLVLSAQAATPSFSLSEKKIEGVSLADSADLGQGKLTRLGAGLRYKKVVLLKANVYVAQLFGDEPAKYKRSEAEALVSLRDQKQLAIQLTFLRSVDADTIRKSYREGFEENKTSPDTAGVKDFLAAVGAGGDAKDGSTMLISASRGKGAEKISYAGPNGQSASFDAPEGTIEKIFALWLGKMGDSGLESLKRNLTE